MAKWLEGNTVYGSMLEGEAWQLSGGVRGISQFMVFLSVASM
jgi:hypothetical protein